MAEQIDSADLVVGVLSEFDSNTIAKMCDELHTVPGPLRIAVLHDDQQKSPPPVTSDTTQGRAFVFLVPSLLPKPDFPATGVLSMSETYQSVFAAAEKLQARGCRIIASKLEAATPPWAWRIAQPLFESQADLVRPHYAHRKFEGLLNASILVPMMRALYGKRVNNPMGPDFGVSQRPFQKMSAAKATGSQLNSLASLTPTALCENLQIIEVNFGTRIYPPTDWSNMSSVLADVLTPVFVDMERNAPFWQRTRVSGPLPVVGEPFRLDQDSPAGLAALIVLFVGNVLARFLGRSVLIGAVNLNLQYTRFLSVGVKWIVIVLAFAMALEHLRIAPGIVELAFGILFGGIVLTLALAVGLNSKDLIAKSVECDVQKGSSEAVEDPLRHL
jgi:hypothetical protein